MSDGDDMIGAASVPDTLAARSARLFQSYRDGNEAAMSDLVDLLTPLLWHTVRAQRVDEVAAEDVVQSAWLALVRNAERIADPQALLQWLLVTAKREAWRVVRRGARVEVTDIEADDVVADPRDMPEAVVVRVDGADRLWTHVANLPERCQELLRVIAFSDRPDYAGVAQALGMPVGSIGPTRGRCLAKLRQMLDKDPAWRDS